MSDKLSGKLAAPKETIGNIQSLRAIAAILVVFVHLEVFLHHLDLKPFGHCGVDIFFVISGFIMVQTTRRGGHSPARFMANRIARVVPLYWLLTLGVFSLALAVPSLVQNTTTDPIALINTN